ncbi:hypothetical protein GCM10007301_26680 [Azorhizobium oxalatiphilum]|uniref:Uncharacterized protein n=1 Tax=Azorhizobium oxalatiphilum TaxID=980631 RepID=A0A917FCR8_9HYPH|nr:hypothetical protein [Azorhizobium oxalatiphilum]GGF65587.1 hypothetical protein GCM10007301_26680 [Azorhizobium oxalatiphilum]
MRLTVVAGMCLALAGGATPALAKGPGKYKVEGVNSEDNSKYSGTAVITKTGKDSWRVVSTIDGDKFDGYAIGDEELLAVTFTGNGSSGVALYVVQPDGSYKGIWAFKGDSKISAEMLTPQ